MSQIAKGNKEAPPKRKHLSLIQRYGKWVPYLGAALLLLALIVREQFRDKTKEDIDAIQAARSLFLIRGDTLHAPQEIINNLDRPNHLRHGAAIPKAELEEAYSSQLALDFQADIVCQHFVDTVSRLASVLRLSNKDNEKLESLKTRVKKQSESFGKLSSSLVAHAVTPQDYDLSVRQLIDTGSLDWDVFDFGTKLLDQTDAEVARRESALQWYSWISYLLAIGTIVLSFLAKAYGLDFPEAGE
jgi:hypothetical protein